MTELERLTRRYAAAGDEELRDAVRVGPEGYRPEVWRVIHAEVSRRGLRTRGGVRRGPARSAGAQLSRRPAPEWTPGLLIGIVPAGVAAAGAFRVMAGVGMGGGRGSRGLVIGTAVIFAGVWFGVALGVDWRRWWPGRR